MSNVLFTAWAGYDFMGTITEPSAVISPPGLYVEGEGMTPNIVTEELVPDIVGAVVEGVVPSVRTLKV